MAVSALNMPAPLLNTSATQSGEDEKIWTRLLSEVSSKNTNQQKACVIVLGDAQSGKTSLLNRLRKADQADRGSPLDYHVLQVQNDARDSSYAYSLGTAGAAANLGPADQLSLPVWVLDGNEVFSPLLSHCFQPTSPSRAVAVYVASIDNPGIIHSLRRWANVLAGQVSANFDKAVIEEAKQAQERFWQEYVEPCDASMHSSIMISSVSGANAAGLDVEDGLLPLEAGTLAENCGVSAVVVVTKSDLGTGLSHQQADRILVQVRRFCLAHGAALVYTSAKNAKNIQLLQKYLVHRAFSVPFTVGAQMIDREELFVPAGWDGEKKIEIIKEGVPDADVPLEPTREKQVSKEPLVEAEDEQAFLHKLLNMESTLAAAAPKKTAASALADDVDPSSPLASFFSNLLKDKPGAKSSPAPPANNAETQAQLDRILKGTGGADSSA